MKGIWKVNFGGCLFSRQSKTLVIARALEVKSTPYEAVHGRKAEISHLRSFGAKCWLYNEIIKGKLDNRGIGRRNLGFEALTDGHLVTKIGSRKVVNARRVIFDEMAKLEN